MFPLPGAILPVALGAPNELAAVGDRLIVAGVGSTVYKSRADRSLPNTLAG